VCLFWGGVVGCGGWCCLLYMSVGYCWLWWGGWCSVVWFVVLCGFLSCVMLVVCLVVD
jgi:hypothetical protein